MKRYYLKQKVLALKDTYSVFDESGKEVFHVKGAWISFTRRKDFCEPTGEILFTIRRMLFHLLPHYSLTDSSGKEVANIKKRFTVLSHRIDILSSRGDYSITGDFMAHDFTIEKAGQAVVEIHKKWMSWGDSYEIGVSDEENASFYVALVVMIDDCLYNRKNHR
ncbi:MAG TPA: LURP-one-related family protein [Bacillota bacterium]|nr:LURP-one-related family protein [Bacillota bacterium]HPQ62052.1 LURP-one-related family protein [Bacillota bacterium]